ncbi:DNA-binding protein, partial [Mesorhizobium sp. M00.F.Ca.ET.158.01.1.1]
DQKNTVACRASKRFSMNGGE